MIIGLSGKAGSGKDTLADVLVSEYNYTKYSFSDNLKSTLAELFELDIDIFYDRSLKDTLFDTPIMLTEDIEKKLLNIAETQLKQELIFPKLKTREFISPREMMQIVGTEVFRHWDTNYWVNLIDLSPSDNIVITDARMPNERELVRTLGGTTILVKRPQIIDPNKPESDCHSTENTLGEESEYDCIINNDTSKYGLERQFKMWYNYKYIEFKLWWEFDKKEEN